MSKRLCRKKPYNQRREPGLAKPVAHARSSNMHDQLWLRLDILLHRMSFLSCPSKHSTIVFVATAVDVYWVPLISNCRILWVMFICIAEASKLETPITKSLNGWLTGTKIRCVYFNLHPKLLAVWLQGITWLNFKLLILCFVYIVVFKIKFAPVFVIVLSYWKQFHSLVLELRLQ